MAIPKRAGLWGCILTVLGLWLSAGCGASSRTGKESSSIPSWLLRTPVEQGKLYAVGIVGPTRFPEDAKKYAADAARKELAKSLQSKVESILLVVQSSAGWSYQDEAFAVEATSLATEVVTHNSQILEYWVDSEGRIPESQKGTTYALGVLFLSGFPEQLAEKAKAHLAPEQAKAIQERAEEAFQELEEKARKP